MIYNINVYLVCLYCIFYTNLINLIIVTLVSYLSFSFCLLVVYIYSYILHIYTKIRELVYIIS